MFVSVLLLGLLVAPAAHALTDAWAAWSPFTGHLQQLRHHDAPAVPGVPRSGGRHRLARHRAACRGRPPSSGRHPTGGEVRLQPGFAVRHAPGQGRQRDGSVHDDVHVRQPDSRHRLGVRARGHRQRPGGGARDRRAGDPVSAAAIDGWFQGTFNYAGGPDLPAWDRPPRPSVEPPETSTPTAPAAGSSRTSG